MQRLNKLALTPKRLFLIDSLGAVLTALLLSQVLARFETVFGMPRNILYILAGVAVVFAIYSFLCHLLVKDNWRSYLILIAIANTLYCMVTLGLVVYYFGRLTYLGVAYFIGEIIIVLSLVRIELAMYKIKKSNV